MYVAFAPSHFSTRDMLGGVDHEESWIRYVWLDRETRRIFIFDIIPHPTSKREHHRPNLKAQRVSLNQQFSIFELMISTKQQQQQRSQLSSQQLINFLLLSHSPLSPFFNCNVVHVLYLSSCEISEWDPARRDRREWDPITKADNIHSMLL